MAIYTSNGLKIELSLGDRRREATVSVLLEKPRVFFDVISIASQWNGREWTQAEFIRMVGWGGSIKADELKRYATAIAAAQKIQETGLDPENLSASFGQEWVLGLDLPAADLQRTRQSTVYQIINWLSANADAIAQDNDVPRGDIYDITDLLANFYPEEEES